MVYCISDIHGEYDRYMAMLEKIQLSDSDTLYVIGDVIDRNPHGVEILLDIMQRDNVQMILGNHEQMCIDDLHWHEWDARKLWQNNGGSCTRRELLYKRSAPERNRILQFLRDLPSCVDLEVNGRKFHLVHGYPNNEKYYRIWNRPDPKAPAPIPGVTVVIGHTPTIYLIDYQEEEEPYKIWHGDGLICIDCGCGNETELRRLACLRLDDMAEFYV